MPVVVSVEALDNYQLKVVFDDATQGVISLADRLFGSVFEPLKDPEVFRQVFVDEFGAISWPNGADLAPDAIHRQFVGACAVA